MTLFKDLFKNVLVEEECTRIAREIADENGWTWRGTPVVVKRWFTWVVLSNAEKRGLNVRVTFRKRDGKVLFSGFCRR